uniref:Uncharacterized protein n=1 Tax=Arundo donax TaxID=35708 RepID=A0A0A9EMW7_ARUDO
MYIVSIFVNTSVASLYIKWLLKTYTEPRQNTAPKIRRTLIYCLQIEQASPY